MRAAPVALTWVDSDTCLLIENETIRQDRLPNATGAIRSQATEWDIRPCHEHYGIRQTDGFTQSDCWQHAFAEALYICGTWTTQAYDTDFLQVLCCAVNACINPLDVFCSHYVFDLREYFQTDWIRFDKDTVFRTLLGAPGVLLRHIKGSCGENHRQHYVTLGDNIDQSLKDFNTRRPGPFFRKRTATFAGRDHAQAGFAEHFPNRRPDVATMHYPNGDIVLGMAQELRPPSIDTHALNTPFVLRSVGITISQVLPRSRSRFIRRRAPGHRFYRRFLWNSRNPTGAIQFCRLF